MTARLDRLLQRMGQDVVVQSEVAVVHGPAGSDGRRDARALTADRYERHVFSALKAVTPEERECIELTYFDGLTVDDIACRLSVTIQVVEERLRHGLEDMVRYLQAHL